VTASAAEFFPSQPPAAVRHTLRAVSPPVGMFAETLRTAAANTPEESLRVMTDLAAAAGPGDAATITLLHPGGALETVSCTDDRAAKADRLQTELGAGPGVDAAHTDGLIITQDLLTEDRWPAWAPQAAGLGVGAAVAVHLFVGNDALGSLNLYSTTPRRYCTADLNTAALLAAHASVMAAHARDVANLWRAIDTRTLIGQAQGMLMQRYGLDPAAAFTVLRRYSNNLNIKIVDVAEKLISTGQLPDIPQSRHPAITEPPGSP
jgi:GAF domain-containing protein